MPEEVGIILNNLESIKSYQFGDLEINTGKFKLDNSREILLTIAWSGWGKVSAARATTRLLSSNLNSIPIDIIIFTGVAGAVDKKLKKWDLIIADSVIQHDFDARPIFDKFVIPALNEKKIIPNLDLVDKIFNELKKELSQNHFFKLSNLYKGLVATGDMFISNTIKLDQLSQDISGLYAVEMEGAAFAQVAFQEKVNWLVIRIISDGANESASNDFNEFLKEYKLISFDLLRSLVNILAKD
tara:strand:+ start:2097 stop:2822 length:726 start_codon:yes stop_codon:yes gene_type:complete